MGDTKDESRGKRKQKRAPLLCFEVGSLPDVSEGWGARRSVGNGERGR